MRIQNINDLPPGAVLIPQPSEGRVLFLCPGCETHHWCGIDEHPKFKAGDPEGEKWRQPVWEFNGDYVKPTFNPSILVHGGHGQGQHRCHSYVAVGQIQFLSDCTHKLAGQTVPIPQSWIITEK